MANRITIEKHDTVEVLQAKLKRALDEAYKTRLKAIIAARQGKKRYEIVEQLMVDPKSVTTWLKRYNSGGTVLLETNKGGRPEGNPKWSASFFSKLTKEIDKGGYWSIPRMQDWLSKHCKVTIPEQTIRYRMDQLRYSYKSARPHPVQGNKAKQASFKKGGLFRSWSR